jgi:hypothetical protein
LARSPLFRLAFVAKVSHDKRFPVQSYWDSPSKWFMHGDARERMASIPVLMKIIARFTPAEQRARICEVLWVISESKSADLKWMFMRLFAQVIVSAIR